MRSKGALKKVEGTFTFKRCVNGVVNREARTGSNECIERVESFVYIGDKLSAGEGCLSAVTARVRGVDEIQGVEWGLVWKEMVSEDEKEGV